MPIRRLLTVLCFLALAVLACSVTVDLGNSPAGTPTAQLSGAQQISTMVAQTLQALTQQALSAVPQQTATPTATATASPTGTAVPAALSVSVATNCYAGPSTHYGFVITIYPGLTVNVVGKDTADGYWIIAVPNYPGTVCWLSGQYASVSGDSGGLPAPATPAASIYTLDEPRALRISCSSQTLPVTPTPGPGWWSGGSLWTVVLRWINTDSSQTGVRVYRGGRRIASLSGGARSYTDAFFHHAWHGDDDITYGVQAFNNYALSSIVTVDLEHCH